MDHVKGALGPLLPKVDELLKLVECKMEPDWESVKTELVSLQSKLQDLKTEGRYIEVELGKSPSSQLAIKVWAEVRELSYDVEDVVDNYLLCLEGSEPIPDIDTLKQLVQKVTGLDLWEKIPADAMINDTAAARPASTRSIDPKGQAMYTDIPHLVGMRESMDSLINMISKVKVATVTSEMSEENSSDKVSSKYTAWAIPDNSQYEDQNLPSKKKPRIASDFRFGEEGKTTLVPEVLDKINEDAPCQDSVNLEISDMMSEEYSARYGNLLTEVPAGTSEKVSFNDTWPIKDDSQNEDKNMPSRNKPKIACVVGFGGLGKTTLVRTLYDKIKTDFSCKAFVSVGQNGNEKKILMDILLDLDKEKKEKKYTTYGLDRLDVMQLLKELQEFLSKKRYLIVIDDIWKEKLWKLIECSFRNEHQLGSQVFTTTRSLNVAQACCASDDHLIYRMKPLSDEDSKSLFYRRVFSQEGGECPPCIEQVSAAILKKCGGVPLAIITIASLLASNGEGIKAMDEWNHVLNSIGRGLTEGDSVVEMNRILSLSYYDLPAELKNCLLYTTVFPEDSKIKKDRLVSKWIAEGLVQGTNQEDSLFDIAENYFNMLINRSLIEPVNIDGEGKAKACRVHDMVLGFLCSLSTEANFITIVDGNRTASNSETKIRRLSVQDCMRTAQLFTAQLPTTTRSMGMGHVRSLTISSCTVINDLVPPLSAYQALRVLDFTDCNVLRNFSGSIHLHIQRLLYVRYLGLRNLHFSILPTDVGRLRYLQILDLRNTLMKKLPSSIVELRELIYLRVYPETRLPDEFGKLTSLEKLIHLQVNQGFAYVAKQLGYLTKLRVLRISPCGMDESLAKKFVESLNKLVEIRILEFKSRYAYEIQDGSNECIRHMVESWKPSSHLQKFHAKYHCFHELPKWINGSSNISCLSICMEKVRRDDIELLGMLQNLRSLKLKEKCIYPSKQTMGFQFENDLFPVARELRIKGTVVLPSMFPKGAMPKVQILEFHVRLDDFGKMNLQMWHLPMLKEVNVNIWMKWYKEGHEFIRLSQLEILVVAAAQLHPNRPTCIVSISYDHEYRPTVPEFQGKVEFESLMSMPTNGEEEALKKQPCSSDMEEVDEASDVQASQSPLLLTEIGEPSGLAWKRPVEKRSVLQLLNPTIGSGYVPSDEESGKTEFECLIPMLTSDDEESTEEAASFQLGWR